MFLGSTSSRIFSSSCSRRQRLRSAIATARLASDWPMMKRSSSETISRGEKSVMTFRAFRIAIAEWRRAMDKHDDVQSQIVPDRIEQCGLDEDAGQNRRPHRQPVRDEETGNHRQRIAHRVEDAVAVIVERNRRRAVALDDEAGIL